MSLNRRLLAFRGILEPLMAFGIRAQVLLVAVSFSVKKPPVCRDGSWRHFVGHELSSHKLPSLDSSISGHYHQVQWKVDVPCVFHYQVELMWTSSSIPVVKTLCFQYRECRFSPWLGNQDHMRCMPKKKKKKKFMPVTQKWLNVRKYNKSHQDLNEESQLILSINTERLNKLKIDYWKKLIWQNGWATLCLHWIFKIFSDCVLLPNIFPSLNWGACQNLLIYLSHKSCILSCIWEFLPMWCYVCFLYQPCLRTENRRIP